MTRHGLPSPPWFATGTPLPFRGRVTGRFRGAERRSAPLPTIQVPFPFGTVFQFRYRFALYGLCTVELFTFRFFGGYPGL